jgi:hypothetical protein
VCVGVEDELCCEDAGEENVQVVKEVAGLGERAVVGDQLAVELGLRDVDEEVLPGAAAVRLRVPSLEEWMDSGRI